MAALHRWMFHDCKCAADALRIDCAALFNDIE